MTETSRPILHIYIRVSSEISVKQNNSLPAQQLAGIKRAEELGFDYEIHEERAKTASVDTLDNRPVLRAILEKCEDKQVQHFFVTEMDRLTRNRYTELYIKKVFIDNAVMIYTTGQTIDLRDDEQAFVSEFLTLMAQREVKMKNKRVKRTLLESAKKGTAGGGVMLPYGFSKDNNKKLQIDSDEAEIVKRIFTLSLEGVGSPKIAALLNKEGIATRGRKALVRGLRVKNKYTGFETHKTEHDLIWKPGTVMGMLKNTLYKGERHFKDIIIPIEPIISPDMWQKVQDNLSNNRAYSGGVKKHFYLLKGLLRCGRCNRNLYGYTKENRGQYVYMCSSKREGFCGMKSVNIGRLDNLVWKETSGMKLHLKAILEELKNDEARNSRLIANQQKLLFVEEQLSQLMSRKENLLQLFLSKRIDLKMFDKEDASIQVDQEKLTKNKYELQAEVTALQSPANIMQAGLALEQLFFKKATPNDDEKRNLLLSLVQNIEIEFDDATKRHSIRIILKMERPAIVRHLEPPKKKHKDTSDPTIGYGDYKKVDDILTDGKIWNGEAESVYTKLFPPVAIGSHH